MAYPKDLLRDIEQNMDSMFVSYFEKNKERLALTHHETFYDYLCYVIEFYFKGYVYKDELLPLVNKIMTKKRSSKKYIYSSYMNNLNLSIYEDANPRSFITKLNESDYAALFGSLTYEEVVSNHKKEIEEWHKNRDCLLLNFPGLPYLKNKMVLEYMGIDIILHVWRYITTNYGGNMEISNISYPSSFIGAPFASDKSLFFIKKGLEKSTPLDFDVPLENSHISSLVYETESGQYVLDFLQDYVDSYGKAIVIGPDFVKGLSYIMNSIDDLPYFLKTNEISINVREMAKFLVGGGSDTYVLNESNIARAVRVLDFMYAYSVKEEGVEGDSPVRAHYRLLSSLKYIGGGSRMEARLKATELLADTIINENYILIPQKTYGMLENSISKVLAHALKKEQIVMSGEDSRTGFYSYSFFQRNILFSSKSKKKNMDLVLDSLNEFVDKKIIISSFVVRGDGFDITFLPIGKDDIKVNKDNQP